MMKSIASDTGFRIVIPARYASERLPGKPLLPVGRWPMIWHTYQCALRSQAKQVVIATDDERVVHAAKNFGAAVCLTSDKHQSGTDRIAEVAEKYGWPDDAVIVNLQGDEPEMPVSLLNQVAAVLGQHANASIATLVVKITHINEVFDPNVVKVVTSQKGTALYFSRASIPWKRHEFTDVATATSAHMLRHLGIYAYQVGFLRRFVAWPPAPIEQLESLEQLRALWYGEKIAVAIAKTTPPPGIDTEKDYQQLLEHFHAST